MSAFECYKEYVALKQHFTKPSYDYFKYNGKSKASLATFEARKDKLYFQKLAKHNDPSNYIVANLVENPKLWIKEIIFSPDAQKVYGEWQRRQQSLTYIFKQDISNLDDDFNSNFICKNNQHPIVMRLYLQHKITIETLSILTKLTGCIPYWEKNMAYDPVAQDIITKIKKYTPFINYDREKIKNIVVDKFSEVN
jgi:hypothetical protein